MIAVFFSKSTAKFVGNVKQKRQGKLLTGERAEMYDSGMKRTPSRTLQKAVNMIGGQAATGRLLGITQQSVWKWVRDGKEAPPQHVLKLEEATGIHRHYFRPDIYPEKPKRRF